MATSEDLPSSSRPRAETQAAPDEPLQVIDLIRDYASTMISLGRGDYREIGCLPAIGSLPSMGHLRFTSAFFSIQSTRPESFRELARQCIAVAELMERVNADTEPHYEELLREPDGAPEGKGTGEQVPREQAIVDPPAFVDPPASPVPDGADQ